MWQYNYTNELNHYGILGMKWGVRRYQNKDGTLTPRGKRRYQNKDGTLTEAGKKKEKKETNDSHENQKKRLKKIIAITGASIVTAAGVSVAVYQYKKNKIMSSTTINALKRGSNLDIIRKLKDSSDVEDIFVPKGSILQRVSNVAEKDFRGDMLYTSISNDDARRYKILFERHLSSKKLFNIKLSAVNDIKAPSDKRQFEIFTNLMKTNDSFSSLFVNQFRTESDIRRDPVKAAESSYHLFMTRIYDTTRPENRIFKETIKKLGYNALFDTNDAGVWSTSPLIALDPSDNLTIDTVKKIGLGEKIVAVMLAKDKV